MPSLPKLLPATLTLQLPSACTCAVWMLLSASVRLTSGRPVVQLQDLVAALRAFPPGGSPTGLIMCSIDPSKEGLAAMQNFLRSIGSTAVPGDTAAIVDGLRTSMGLQKVRVEGVSPKTRFAQVMVHEFTHAVVTDLAGHGVPPRWLNEGLAENVRLAAIGLNGKIAFLPPDRHLLGVPQEFRVVGILKVAGVAVIGGGQAYLPLAVVQAAARKSR